MISKLISIDPSSSSSSYYVFQSSNSHSKSPVRPSTIPTLPSFLDVDIGRYYPSDDEIRNCFAKISAFLRDRSHLTCDILERIVLIFSQIHQRLCTNHLRLPKPRFFLPVNRRNGLTFNLGTAWHVLLSIRDPPLTTAVFNIMLAEWPYLSSDSGFDLLKRGIIPSIFSALDMPTLLSTPLSHPLHESFFFVLAKLLVTHFISFPWYNPEGPRPDPRFLDRNLFTPLRPFLVAHLKNPTTFSSSISQIRQRHRFDSYFYMSDENIMEDVIEYFPVLFFLRISVYNACYTDLLITFISDVMQQVREERRNEGFVEDGPVPLFVTTPLHSAMTPSDLVPLLDSANVFLQSRPTPSPSQVVDFVIFIVTFQHHFCTLHSNIRTHIEAGTDLFSSMAKLFVLSSVSSSCDVRMVTTHLFDSVFPYNVWNLDNLAKNGFVAELVDTAHQLGIPHSEHKHRFHDFICWIVHRFVHHMPKRPSFEYPDSKNEQLLEALRTRVLESVFVPARPSLVHQARSSYELLHLSYLETPFDHPATTYFFEGVWEDVRREAIELVCGDDITDVPAFLKMNVFWAPSTEDADIALSSLSSFILAHPSPPQPVLSSIHLLLKSLGIDPADVGNVSDSDPHRFWIIPNSKFVQTAASSLPPLLLSPNSFIRDAASLVVKRIITHDNHIFVRDFTEADFIVNILKHFHSQSELLKDNEDEEQKRNAIALFHRTVLLYIPHCLHCRSLPVTPVTHTCRAYGTSC
ncbi:hypothetical protein BLNAU_20732 [Blattamonas nauphoetae]|uniref:Uncharacterized protein n=1 Tax=Blattamonas nauphoetae TaxID=2049346 RepID=A0ABQ9WYD9_9EUKA|nr:hypothetical protein BLNAU_20732 [Blattamonas nauphoetae]